MGLSRKQEQIICLLQLGILGHAIVGPHSLSRIAPYDSVELDNLHGSKSVCEQPEHGQKRELDQLRAQQRLALKVFPQRAHKTGPLEIRV